MGEHVYKLAIDRARSLRHELQRLDSFISTYEELMAHSPAPTAKAEPSSALPPPAAAAPEHGRSPKAAPQEELERVVMRVLLENGAPLQRQALFNKVKATGTTIGGQDERSNFGSKISRSDRFVNLPKLGYWPKDRPFEAASYRPT